MFRYLIDTDILIDHLRGYKKAKDFLSDIINKKDQLLISVITEAEIFSGKLLQNNDEMIKTEIFIDLFLSIPLTTEIARLAGSINIKHQIGLADSIIAATAIKNNLVLLTRNNKHFKNIYKLKINIPYL